MPRLNGPRANDVHPDSVRTDYELPRYPSLQNATDKHASGDNYALTQGMSYARAPSPGPLPDAESIRYTEHDLQPREAYVKEIKTFSQDMVGNLFTSSLTRYTAIGGTAALTVLGVLIGVKDAAHAYEQDQNGQKVTVFTKPQFQNLVWEVPLGVGLYAAFMGFGLYRQYSVRNKLKNKVLANELARSKHLADEMNLLVASNHPQAEQARRILKDVKDTQSSLGYTPGQDAKNILKGTALALPISAATLVAATLSLAVCALAVCAASGGGGGDCGSDACCLGSNIGCNCGGGDCCTKSTRMLQAPVKPVPPHDGWETVLNRRLPQPHED